MSRDVVRTPDAARVPRNVVWEHELLATRAGADPWAEIELDVEFTDPAGRVRVVPAYWAGGHAWRVRYSAEAEGVHRYRTVVRADGETGLEDRSGELTVTPYEGSNPLLLHGAPRVADDGRHFAHADGTPFLWLGDTWWTGMTKRHRWPDAFQTLADDRAAKGYSVVQIVAGLVPECTPFEERMASEGGQPWLEQGAGPINPAYYDVPDEKIDYLVASGIAPCIVGGWGYFARHLGRERILRHWRYVVARYGAYPVVWCIAGEVDLVLPITQPERIPEQVSIWEDAARLVGEIDPFARARTTHPCPIASCATSEALSSRDLFEFDILQTGHGGFARVAMTMEHVLAALAHGDKPVMNVECSYEGLFESFGPDLQRFLFWSHMLSGTAGHTYGTMAISTINAKDEPLPPLARFANQYWEDAIGYAGAAHLAVGKAILERLRWWELAPAQDAIAPAAGPERWLLPYAARTPDGTLVVFVPGLGTVTGPDGDVVNGPLSRLELSGLTPGASYRGTWVDPCTGEDDAAFSFQADAGGGHAIAAPITFLGVPLFVQPTGADWVLIVEREA